MQINKKILIAIPRYSLSGGNIVSIELAKILERMGYDVYTIGYCKPRKLNDANLIKRKKSFFNSISNMVSYVIISVIFLFSKKQRISTHHLTSLTSFLRKSDYIFIQDYEFDFYPKKFKMIGSILWKNYFINTSKKIYTNKILAHKCNDKIEIDGFPFSFSSEQYMNQSKERDIDYLFILRDGEYKNPETTLDVFKALNERYCCKLINASKIEVSDEGIIQNATREDVLNYMRKSKIFISLSKYEGLGLPIIEAFLSGCNIVATKIPATEILRMHNEDAFTVISSENTSISDTIVKYATKALHRENNDIHTRIKLVKTLNDNWETYIDEQF